ncbi:uncharacterized protein [Miscanthus floridulus]|uniref:uncharacterized protein n=1 Tax=Miscanthus floridulus TaxID=154761 RepID=UPI00345AA6FD
MAKGKAKADAFASSHERSVNWYEDQSKYMLEWCTKYLKKQHARFKFKKAHIMLCANDLNKKFAMGMTVDQVDRHYRYHRENWKYIATALSNSGNTFDEKSCMVNISESEKEKLCDRARRLLAKPIKFFNEMRELFIGSNIDGSLALDQNTCMDAADGSDSDDLNTYTQPEDLEGVDLDTLPTPTRHATVDNTSFRTSEASKKRPRAKNSPTKKPKKSRFAYSTDEISATMKSLRETLAATASPPMPHLTDPHAAL